MLITKNPLWMRVALTDAVSKHTKNNILNWECLDVLDNHAAFILIWLIEKCAI